MTDKLNVEAKDVALAALNGWLALMGELVRNGTLTSDDANAIGATAASMCQANGGEVAAALIKNMMPTSVGVDPVAHAKSKGATIKREK